MEQGVRKVWWKDDGNGNMKIVASSFQPRDVGEAHFLKPLAAIFPPKVAKSGARPERRPGRWMITFSLYASTAMPCSRAGGARKISGGARRRLWSRVRSPVNRGAFSGDAPDVGQAGRSRGYEGQFCTRIPLAEATTRASRLLSCIFERQPKMAHRS